MSFQRLILQWLAARTVETVKQQAVKELFSTGEERSETESKPLVCGDNPETAGEREKPDSAPERPEVDFGFVFAMPMEASGVADCLKRKKTTRGDGRTFHTGFFGEHRVALVESGVGQEKAAQAAEVLIDLFQPKRLLSTGYGGGLSKRLKRFNICFPEMLVRESDDARLDLSEPVPQRIESFEPGPVRGRLALLTTDFVASTPKQKSRLHHDTGAELVDMETFAVADICRRHEIPFLAIRIILDTAEEELPKDIQSIMKNAETGGARLVGSVLGSMFSRPSSVLDLFSLQQRALEATDRLAKKIATEIQGKG